MNQSTAAGEDAEVSAAAYLEHGEAPIETYEELDKVADAYAAQKRGGSVPGEYHAKRCSRLPHQRGA